MIIFNKIVVQETSAVIKDVIIWLKVKGISSLVGTILFNFICLLKRGAVRTSSAVLVLNIGGQAQLGRNIYHANTSLRDAKGL